MAGSAEPATLPEQATRGDRTRTELRREERHSMCSSRAETTTCSTGNAGEPAFTQPLYQRLRHVLAQLGQLAAAAGAGGRAWNDDLLTRQVRRQGRAHRLAAGRAVGAAGAALLV